MVQNSESGAPPPNMKSPWFDGKILVKDTLILNGLIFTMVALQYIYIPLKAGILLPDFALVTYIIAAIAVLSLLGARYYRVLPISVYLNSFLLLVGVAAFAYLCFFFNGPYNIPMLGVNAIMLCLNLIAFTTNLRGHYVGSLGNVLLSFWMTVTLIIFFASTYSTLVDRLMMLLPILIFTAVLWPWLGKAKNYRFNPRVMIKKVFNKSFFSPADFTQRKKDKLTLIGVLSIILISAGIAAYTGGGWSKTIKAEEDFQTTSSYWGPPSLALASVNSQITPTSINRLDISNATLANDPDSFIPGAFAYVTGVSIPGNEINYANYSTGAESYPNGTIILSQALPSLASVNVTFKYVTNIKALQYLNISSSTLVMNFHGDFIYSNNTFDSITKTYLLQLLDYWEIQYYLDISNGYDFPHIFNYLDSIPIGYTTLNWAHQAGLTMFQGISYDFEPGGDAVAQGAPGGVNLTVGEMITGDQPWDRLQRSWYHYNEQNRTLLAESTAAYENLYAYASSLGYTTYNTMGLGEVYDALDGDSDYSRAPMDPISENPDVYWGHMNYQDAQGGDLGNYRIYKGCSDQISMLGDQGKTILLGWLAKGTSYYTDDEQGLNNYIEHCKIAQAAGMVEIFHAPIYRMQGKWGDDAILRLHEALNEDPKEEWVIRFPSGEINEGLLFDVIENLNYLFVAIPLYCVIAIRLVGFGALRPNKSPRSNEIQKTEPSKA